MDTTEDFSPYRADGKLYGFVCVVTGASQPVGQAIIRELAAHGAASIYACDKTASSDTYKTLVEQVGEESPNSKIIPYPFNVAKEHETLVLIGPPSIEATTPDDLQKCFEAHSLAPFFALKYVPAAMAKLTQKGTYPNAAPKTQKYGSIIVISSVASVHGGCWGPCYTMTSHAALGVVKAGVATLKGTGVRINCISPGQIDVGVDLQGFPPASLQSPEVQRTTIGLERAGKTQEVARVAGFLASGFSSYVNGANIIVDGGASLAQFGVIASKDPSAIESTCRDYGLSGAEFKELHERCVAAKSSAYCPYSKFRVGASVISVDGSYFDGGNIENASYPVGTCAERVALCKAVSEGHRKIKAVAVATDISPPASPCGMCRQFIREFCDLKSPIIMFDKNDNYVVLRLEEILPMSFGPEALPPPGSLKP
ncbi:hypothetical protein DL770_003331 [Monosporascus sp. CRB-9-2]|nr:hypothetical protein DL770_003331 [Monosporascus sp. CRB-9-2]